MSDQEKFNREAVAKIQRLDVVYDALTQDVIDMRETLHGLVKEVGGIKRILWVIAGAILANAFKLDAERVAQILELLK